QRAVDTVASRDITDAQETVGRGRLKRTRDRAFIPARNLPLFARPAHPAPSHGDESGRYYLSSIISRTTLRLVREATALRIVRIDLAVRPCLPITRPKSSLATRSSSTEAVSPWVSLTSTASGLLTNCCARN